MATIQHFLDYNQFYSLTLDYDRKTRLLKVSMDGRGNPWPRFQQNILSQLNVISTITPQQRIFTKRSASFAAFQQVPRQFTLRLGSEPIATYELDTANNLNLVVTRPLTVDETRRMGTFYECTPYPQRRKSLSQEKNLELLETAKNAVTTDFHTHSSGQISAHGLIAVAKKHKPYFYPVSLLREAGIVTDYDSLKKRKMIPRIPFPPTELPGVEYPKEIEGADLNELTPADIEKLAQHMAIPADRQGTFTQLEYEGYRFRTPLSKDPQLNRAIREQEAAEYIKQGVKFALTSYTSIDKPDILNVLHDITAKAEADPSKKFTQRFMIGIPRGLPPERMREELEKAKILLDSPYVVGVDILGYEANKTKEFIEILDKYAGWANKHKPGSLIRVHAGENDKNYDNVKDFLKIAVKHDRLNYLVGHGVYGMDEETTKLAKRLAKTNQITLEFNPSSNIALNNINDVNQIPFGNAMIHGLPFIIGSDAAGMYHTSPVQLGLAAYYAGLDAKGFHDLALHQKQLMDKITTYSKQIESGIPHFKMPKPRETYVGSLLTRLKKVVAAVVAPRKQVSEETIAAKLAQDRVSLIERGETPEELKGKVPITIFGASGESWRRLSPGKQRENAIAIDMLIHALGDKCYIVQGRNKGVGLSKVINESLRASSKDRKMRNHPELYNVGMLINPSFEEKDSYKHLSHMIHLPPQQLKLANEIVDYTFEHHGVLIGVGGAAYSSDIILEADQRGIHDKHKDNRKMMLLLKNAVGASTDKAAVLHPDYGADDGRQLIKKLYENRPDLFPPHFSTRKLNELYHEASARVTTYGYNQLDSTVISHAQLISSKAISRLTMPLPSASGKSR